MIVSRDHIFKDGELKDKVILVTGANRGFGLAITMDLSKSWCYCYYAWKRLRLP